MTVSYDRARRAIGYRIVSGRKAPAFTDLAVTTVTDLPSQQHASECGRL